MYVGVEYAEVANVTAGLHSPVKLKAEYNGLSLC